jgi:hypothetical protein
MLNKHTPLSNLRQWPFIGVVTIQSLTACHRVSCSHAAGPIGARGNNGVGIVGVCHSGLKQVSVKFMGGPYPGNGTTDAAIAALDYVLALKNKYNLTLVATSNSWWVRGRCTFLIFSNYVFHLLEAMLMSLMHTVKWLCHDMYIAAAIWCLFREQLCRTSWQVFQATKSCVCQGLVRGKLMPFGRTPLCSACTCVWYQHCSDLSATLPLNTCHAGPLEGTMRCFCTKVAVCASYLFSSSCLGVTPTNLGVLCVLYRGGGGYSQALFDAIKRHNDAGIILSPLPEMVRDEHPLNPDRLHGRSDSLRHAWHAYACHATKHSCISF